jgi:hypothetical protein
MRSPLRRTAVRLGLIVAVALTLLPFANTAAQSSTTETAQIFLISLEDGGPIGCGDTVVPVTVEVPVATTTEGKITEALTKLFSLHDPYYGLSGLYNTLYENTLTIDDVRIENDAAGVILSGSTGARGVCDEPRIEAQITETVKQFSGFTRVVIILNGAMLSDAAGPIYFPETDHWLGRPFRTFWGQSGGIPVFGYPLTEQLFENGLRVQYVERQRLEDHPSNVYPYSTLLGLLGIEIAREEGLLDTAPFHRQSNNRNPNCEYVPETGHHLCFGFRDYWHAHGLDFGDAGYSYRESLALFGYPISDEFVINGRTVQYFERARFEWHPENSAPWNILLGRLGAEVLE